MPCIQHRYLGRYLVHAWAIDFVCQFVSLSVRWKTLNKDIVKQFPKLTVALIKVTYVYLIGSKVVLYTLCFSSSFLFNVLIIRHFNTVNTLDMVESRYSLTQHVSIIRWSLGIICWLWSIYRFSTFLNPCILGTRPVLLGYSYGNHSLLTGGTVIPVWMVAVVPTVLENPCFTDISV